MRPIHAKAATAPGDRVLLYERSRRTMVRARRKGKGEDALERCSSPGEQAARQGRRAARTPGRAVARVDLPSALAIANEFPATEFQSTGVLANIAFHLAADNPAEAEHVVSLMSPLSGWGRFPPPLPGRWPRLIRRVPKGSPIGRSKRWTSLTGISFSRWA